jgi:hypothetical protein
VYAGCTLDSALALSRGSGRQNGRVSIFKSNSTNATQKDAGAPTRTSSGATARYGCQGRAPWPAGEGLDSNGALKSSTVRWSAAESNWERASAKARLFEQAVDAGLVLRQNLSLTTGELTTWLADHKKGIGVSSGLTITEAIKKFLHHKDTAPRKKTTRKITADSLYRYEYVLDSLDKFCQSKGIVLIKAFRQLWPYPPAVAASSPASPFSSLLP